MNHALRILLLLAGSTLLLGWVIKHSEPTSSIGLRYIEQAQRVEAGGWREVLYSGIDHPLHPLGIAAAHRLFDGDSPASWQRAALLFSFVSAVLLVIPIYLVALELFGEGAAFLGVALVMANAAIGSIVVNVLSETSFLFWWSFGLWAAVRFLREGRFVWLPLAVAFGTLAYLTRPEGILLPVAVALAMLILPLQRATRINWPRWWGAIMLIVGGAVLLAGPFVAIKGGLGTKPGIARVLGLAPHSAPLALEREKPLPPDQTTIETYTLAGERTIESVVGAVTLPLLPFALVGLVLAAHAPGGSADGLAHRHRAVRIGRRAGAAVCNGRLRDGSARARSRVDPDAGGGGRTGLVDEQGVDSGAMARPGARPIQARTGRLGGADCARGDRSEHSIAGAGSSRAVLGLLHDR